MNKNKLIIAAAGSGKTTFLINEALKIEDKNVLITTYTESNEAEIRRIFIRKKGYIPENITIQTWFSFLMQHGVRPYQDVLNKDLHGKKIGFNLTEGSSGFYETTTGEKRSYSEEKNFFQYYFTSIKKLKIHSDKISKFIYKTDNKTDGEIINRLSRIYPYIFIDEIQDLAGWDLDILKLLFDSKSKILMVGDPRQVVYLTNHPNKYKKYMNGKIKEFIENECKNNTCLINETTLIKSHRNNKWLCDFSSALYNSEYKHCQPCECIKCREYNTDHQGIFLVKEKDTEEYCKKYNPQKLFYKEAKFPDLNYGISKGLSFDRVLIYPTKKIIKYLKNGNLKEIESIRAKFYVAATRARHSVGIIFDYEKNNCVLEVQKYISEKL